MSRGQLLALGLGAEAIKYRVRVGRLHAVHRGVYAVGHRRLSQLGSWSAAVLACGDGAVLSHRSAGQLLGIVTAYSGPIEVSVPRGDKPRHRGVRTRTTTVGPYEVGRRQSIAVTSLARTIFDLTAVLDAKELTRAFQRARRRGLTVRQLERLLDRHRGERGTRALRALVDRHRNDKGLSKGGFEDAFYAWLLGWLPDGFPRPKRNGLVRLSDGAMIEADLVWPELGVVVELDFFDHHGGDRVQTTADHKRDRGIRGDGWKLGRYTSDEFEDDPDAIEADLRKLLGLGGRIRSVRSL